ncbi:MAG: hypothetical protein J6Y94_08205 [Bacteriovoracaceae bacterium]|nr:hypothetical protein [Bacteriovoracaceae bacterium]
MLRANNFKHLFCLLAFLGLANLLPATTYSSELSAQDLAISLKIAPPNQDKNLDNPLPILPLTTAQDDSPASAPKVAQTTVGVSVETQQDISSIVPRGHQHFEKMPHATPEDNSSSTIEDASLALAFRLNFM